MKKTSFFVAAIASAFCSCAQRISPSMAPAVVINAFQQQFPKATDVEWEKKGTAYEVEFETGVIGQDHKLLIDSTGKIMSHKQEIVYGDLPAEVVNELAKQFAGYKVDDTEKIDTNGIITYQMEVKRKPEEWKLTFSEGGKLLEKIAD